ncbi:helix-turn-helix transcriptional regulator [Paenibacillus tritici]|uniref:Helix-turn-helix transcriptional regulator n=1 Tax=Paenibacillus tritici TaxID=1873425 RepID=A0ABX2DX92_9BACL|nr:helix-turn-helix transcriptional regulator [Paenibacillus tritici]
MRQIIGKTIKAIRLQQDLSQEDLAGLCSVDRAYISLIEVGKNEPSVSKIFQLCEGLQTKPSTFFKIVEVEYENLKDVHSDME